MSNNKILTPEELEKRRERQRIYNKKWYNSHTDEFKELQKKLYKEKMQNEEYRKYVYEKQKIARDKLKIERNKLKNIDNNDNPDLNIIKRGRGRPKTLPFFMDELFFMDTSGESLEPI